MDVLNSIALPQSTEHFHLLLFIYNLVMAVAMPYLALLTGVIVLAVLGERREAKGGSIHGHALGREMINAVLPSRSVFLFFGLLPAASMVFVFAQLYQGTTAMATGFSAFGVLCLIAAGIAGFTYQYTFRVEAAMGFLRDDQPSPDAVTELAASAKHAHRVSGRVAFWTILAAAFCLSAAQTIGSNPAHWREIDSFFAALISVDVWLSFLLFLAVAGAITGAAVLFHHYKQGTEGRAHEDQGAGTLRIGIRLSTGAILVVPLLVLVSLLRLPDAAVSGWVFGLAALAVLFLFASLHALYGYVRLHRPSIAAYACAAIVLATTALVSKDQVVLHNVARDHAVLLSVAYDRSTESLKSSLGIAVKYLTGEDIYNAKCSACHLFDRKKVGPPYTATVPKYKGNKAGLVAFILNPGKVDPAFPPMPSQGLKANEADSIATYLLNKIGAKGS
jgi:cytochrome c551/c552